MSPLYWEDMLKMSQGLPVFKISPVSELDKFKGKVLKKKHMLASQEANHGFTTDKPFVSNTR